MIQYILLQNTLNTLILSAKVIERSDLKLKALIEGTNIALVMTRKTVYEPFIGNFGEIKYSTMGV